MKSRLMKRFLRILMMAFCIFWLTNVAMADDISVTNSTMRADEQLWQSLGVAYKFSNNTLEVIINEQTALNSIPMLQAFGAMNSDITQAQINTTPVTLSSSVGLFAITGMLPDLYKDYAKLNNLSVRVYLNYIDDYGNISKRLIYTFNFSRNLYNTINWKRFSQGDLMKVAPNFSITPWGAKKADEELSS